ncbi:hypothetical protein CCHOA_03350 [Corynebacterium choanae]|uniref:Uncharacterized protein n=1 Tax=Corynebacterium choanae TaxID=1862358 RepID=A0A3G6J5D2_9CORY|nr:hypothetical protein CCHOA_03350 [Corynebacterium choanae]
MLPVHNVRTLRIARQQFDALGFQKPPASFTGAIARVGNHESEKTAVRLWIQHGGFRRYCGAEAIGKLPYQRKTTASK